MKKVEINWEKVTKEWALSIFDERIINAAIETSKIAKREIIILFCDGKNYPEYGFLNYKRHGDDLDAKCGEFIDSCYKIFWEHENPEVVAFRDVSIDFMYKNYWLFEGDEYKYMIRFSNNEIFMRR